MTNILAIPGGAVAYGRASGGKIYAYNNISELAATIVAQPNAHRVRITFHNPGAADVFIAPINVQNVIGTAPINPSNVLLNFTNTALGGAFRVYGNGGALVIEGECAGGWQALSVTGAGSANSLTVMESNV